MVCLQRAHFTNVLTGEGTSLSRKRLTQGLWSPLVHASQSALTSLAQGQATTRLNPSAKFLLFFCFLSSFSFFFILLQCFASRTVIYYFSALKKLPTFFGVHGKRSVEFCFFIFFPFFFFFFSFYLSIYFYLFFYFYFRFLTDFYFRREPVQSERCRSPKEKIVPRVSYKLES